MKKLFMMKKDYAYKDTTIAAISTAVSQSGIGIVRISGPEAFFIADRVFRFPGQGQSDKVKRSLESCPSHTIHYGYVYDGEKMVDEVLVSVFRGPRSYTAEDTVEINCHGGVYAMQRVLQAVLHAGAHPAQPGEFTKRAFLNGRLDLSAAEAVMDVIDSQSRFALDNALGQLRGSLRQTVDQLRREILLETAKIESALDDPEHYTLEGFTDQFMSKLDSWIMRVSALRDSYYEGRILAEGVRTVILGRPNAGKSSLLNALLGEERAIVTAIPGTTRDTIREKVTLGDITLLVVDTAGIHDTRDEVERIGIERARQEAREADLCLVVIDSSAPLHREDEQIIASVVDKPCIFLLNKTDKPVYLTQADLKRILAGLGTEHEIISISAVSGDGLHTLKESIRNRFYRGDLAQNDQLFITNERHKRKLDEACEALDNVRNAVRSQLPEDFLTIDLMHAYTSLGEIVGQQVGEDLINEIFDKFCMGK